MEDWLADDAGWSDEMPTDARFAELNVGDYFWLPVRNKSRKPAACYSAIPPFLLPAAFVEDAAVLALGWALDPQAITESALNLGLPRDQLTQ